MGTATPPQARSIQAPALGRRACQGRYASPADVNARPGELDRPPRFTALSSFSCPVRAHGGVNDVATHVSTISGTLSVNDVALHGGVWVRKLLVRSVNYGVNSHTLTSTRVLSQASFSDEVRLRIFSWVHSRWPLGRVCACLVGAHCCRCGSCSFCSRRAEPRLLETSSTEAVSGGSSKAVCLLSRRQRAARKSTSTYELRCTVPVLVPSSGSRVRQPCRASWWSVGEKTADE